MYKRSIAWQADVGNDYEIFYWDGTRTIQVTANDTPDFRSTLYGTMLAWDGYDSTAFGYEIYHTHVIPVPGAVLLGVVGLGVVGVKLRRREES